MPGLYKANESMVIYYAQTMETADEPLTVDPEAADEPAGMRDDAILELAIQFASSGAYPAGESIHPDDLRLFY